jgi:hypothetical protein
MTSTGPKPPGTAVYEFPNTPLTKPEGAPTRADILLIKQELCSQLMMAFSARGTGRHGHIALAISPAEYASLAAEVTPAGAPVPVFDHPVHPGPAADLTGLTTTVQRTAAERAYDADLAEFTKWNTIHQAAKHLLVTCVGKLYLGDLQNQLIGYNNSSLYQLLDYLRITYAMLTPLELSTNRDAITNPWNPDDGIETLRKRVNDGAVFADGSPSPITDFDKTRLGIKLLTDTGVFTEWIEKWEEKPVPEHTWAAFLIHFQAADKLRIARVTAAGAGYHQPRGAANAATSLPGYTYCWTHGFIPLTDPQAHASNCCPNPRVDHNNAATISDMMGGNNRVRRKNGERQIWQPAGRRPGRGGGGRGRGAPAAPPAAPP